MSHTLHEAMMIKKNILQEKFKEQNREEELFEEFWRLYYPRKVEGNMDTNKFNTWLSNIQKRNNDFFTNIVCPFCVQHTSNCTVCQYGAAFGVCNYIKPNAFEQALCFIIQHKLDL